MGIAATQEKCPHGGIKAGTEIATDRNRQKERQLGSRQNSKVSVSQYYTFIGYMYLFSKHKNLFNFINWNF